MSSNMSSTNSAYESASDKYNSLAEKYTGNAGYENSLAEGQKGAQTIADNSINSYQTSARNNGASKNAAAIMAGNNAVNAYGNALESQQDKDGNMGIASVNQAGQNVTNQQTEGSNKYNRSWGNFSGITGSIGSLLSDERCKNYIKITDKVFDKPEKDIGSLKIDLKEKK